MCSIMGYSGTDLSTENFTAHFQRTVSRGPDMSSITRFEKGIFGFHRLSIMGLDKTGMQPFALGKSLVVCNGELYGFRALKQELTEKGYTFQSQSDCELLLPLYREYGLSMFRKLDAEFALILYDGERQSFVAARDPIGIRPLFYGYSASGGILFASEAKNLVGLCAHILPFPPGHYYADRKFVCYAKTYCFTISTISWPYNVI